MAVLLWHHTVEYVTNHHFILKCQISEYYVVSSTAALYSIVFNFKWKQGKICTLMYNESLLWNRAKQLPSLVVGLEREVRLRNSCAAVGTILRPDIFKTHFLCCPPSICSQGMVSYDMILEVESTILLKMPHLSSLYFFCLFWIFIFMIMVILVNVDFYTTQLFNSMSNILTRWI